jgi:hypothetical protein
MPASAFRAQSGFGLLETLAGLVVFLILAMVGTKAFHAVVVNQKETAQVKALTDAVTVTAERLSAMSVKTLTAAGSPYLEWSAPAEIGSGEYHFRYRTFPNPSVSGVMDTSVVGLEVEVGALSGGVFTKGRGFATLISPHLSSKDKLGQASTALERSAEASFYAGLQARIKQVSSQSVQENQIKLNSFNCYDQGQCCGFMDKFFKNPSMRPGDGLDQKCLYRCAMAGSVPIKEWNKSCGTDFCAVAPWKSKEQCCAAISAGECLPGSICAQVCIDCIGEDGSTCGPPICKDMYFNDLVDCAKGIMCDGSDLPSEPVPGLGDLKTICRMEECTSVTSECKNRTATCCVDYWGVLAAGGTPNPIFEVCKTISTHSECCEMSLSAMDWDNIYCGTDGKAISAHNKVDGKWYCGFTGGGWDKACGWGKGCPSTYRPAGASSGNCPVFGGGSMDTPWKATYPDPNPPKFFPGFPPGGGGSKTTTNKGSSDRTPSERGGGIFGSSGGRE